MAAGKQKQEWTRVTGDPFHDVLALRRITPTRMPDAATMVRDHIDALGRLSAPDQPQTAENASAHIEELDPALHPLPEATVAESQHEWLNLAF